jgi:hypothetical protein
MGVSYDNEMRVLVGMWVGEWVGIWPRMCSQRCFETSAPVCNTGAAGTIGDANIVSTSNFVCVCVCVCVVGSLHYVNPFEDFHRTSILMKCVGFI